MRAMRVRGFRIGRIVTVAAVVIGSIGVLFGVGELLFRLRDRASRNSQAPSAVSRSLDSNDKSHIETSAGAPRTRILFLGESTTFCGNIANPELRWPAIVCRMLQEEFPKRNVLCINKSMPGNTLEKTLRRIGWYLDRERPDFIVLLQGLNDLSSVTRRIAEDRGISVAVSSTSKVLHSRSRFLRWLAMNGTIVVRQVQEFFGVVPLVVDSDAMVGKYRTQLDSMYSVVKDSGCGLLAVELFSILDPGEGRLTTIRRGDVIAWSFPYIGVLGFQNGISAINTTVRETSERHGFDVVTTAGLFKPSHFEDAIHLNEVGAEMLAAQIVNTIRGKSLLEKAQLDTRE